MNLNDSLGYAGSFVNFLIKSIDSDINKIDKIILYGSFTSGNITKTSDVDIFIDTKEKIAEKISKITQKFYESKEFMVYRLKGIDNKFSIKTGELIKWKELHRSITSTGIVLYSRYETTKLPEGTKHRILFYWDNIGENRGAFLNKVYGYKIKKKEYPGLLAKWGGKRVGKSCIIVPFENRDEMVSLLKKYKADAKCIEMFSLE